MKLKIWMIQKYERNQIRRCKFLMQYKISLNIVGVTVTHIYSYGKP